MEVLKMALQMRYQEIINKFYEVSNSKKEKRSMRVNPTVILFWYKYRFV